MKILMLAADYPDLDGNIALFYIHTRSMFYLKKGIEVNVLNFKAKEDYIIDNVKVITLDSYKKNNKEKYDMLILHAPNLRNHYKFLKKYGNKFEKHLFFFHGHEVLKINKDYSKPYEYVKTKGKILQNMYDFMKLKIWQFYFMNNIQKSYFIFVSNWMKEMFLKNTKIKEEKINSHSFITYNSIGKDFETSNYDKIKEKQYDFITIRGNIDGSKYCIDIINNLAKLNSELKFLVIGKGEFFNIYEKAENIEWQDRNCSHNEIIEMLNKAKCALMPTRTDAQGLMACEMATFGIPLITSNIPVCYEVFNSFNNVEYIDNNDIEKEDIKQKYNNIINKMNGSKNKKYFLEESCGNEIKIINNIVKK